MPRLCKNILLIVSILLLGASVIFAEEITLTTYYPSPYGVYKNLRLYPNDDNTPGGACTNEGETYFDDSASNLYMCSGSAGSYTWVAVGTSVPQGFCVFSRTQTSCPTGFTRSSQFDASTIYGANSSIGGTGGSATHDHLLDSGGGNDGGWIMPLGVAPESSWPPYVRVLICCKD